MSDIITSTARLLRQERVVAAVGLLFLAMMLLTLFGLALDGRTINGLSVWLKPFKFQLSFAVHVLTVALALGALDRSAREGWAARAILLAFLTMSLFEVVWITVQGARGLPSHFAASRFEFVMYQLMGAGATLIVLATALLGVLVLLRPARQVPRLVSRAVGIGLLVSGIAGMVTGWAIAVNHGPVIGGGGHGPGVPLLGWSGTGGDLRVAHFVGLHAAQVIPLLGLMLNAWNARDTRPVLLAAAVVWSVATLGLFIQALAGRPFIPLG
jgi:hypothetical protein